MTFKFNASLKQFSRDTLPLFLRYQFISLVFKVLNPGFIGYILYPCTVSLIPMSKVSLLVSSLRLGMLVRAWLIQRPSACGTLFTNVAAKSILVTQQELVINSIFVESKKLSSLGKQSASVPCMCKSVVAVNTVSWWGWWGAPRWNPPF